MRSFRRCRTRCEKANSRNKSSHSENNWFTRWPRMNPGTGGCQQISRSGNMRKDGRTKFCQLLARHMSDCNLQTCIRCRKKIASWPPVKPKKKMRRTMWLTVLGRRMSCARNCTKPAGVLPTDAKKLFDHVRHLIPNEVMGARGFWKRKIAPKFLPARS